MAKFNNAKLQLLWHQLIFFCSAKISKEGNHKYQLPTWNEETGKLLGSTNALQRKKKKNTAIKMS